MAKKLRWKQDEPGKWTSECKTHPGYSVVFIVERFVGHDLIVQFCRDEEVMSEYIVAKADTVKSAKTAANMFLQHMLSVTGYYATFGQ